MTPRVGAPVEGEQQRNNGATHPILLPLLRPLVLGGTSPKRARPLSEPEYKPERHPTSVQNCQEAGR
eukprot:7569625-Alexandrium_andersonii.AAC.1